MAPTDRRSILALGWMALGSGFAGCLSDNGPATTGSPTDSPTRSGTSAGECQGEPTDYSWEGSGTWDLDVTVTNDDDRTYQLTLEVVHHGSIPCHHLETSPCESPEKSVTSFERSFDLAADTSKSFTDISLELYDDWIDEYIVEARIEDDDPSTRTRVAAYETGAKEPVGETQYDRADFYVCDGATRTVDVRVSNGTPHGTA